MSRQQIDEHVRHILRLRTREARKEALKAVPSHMRDKVEFEVKQKFKEKKR